MQLYVAAMYFGFAAAVALDASTPTPSAVVRAEWVWPWLFAIAGGASVSSMIWHRSRRNTALAGTTIAVVGAARLFGVLEAFQESLVVVTSEDGLALVGLEIANAIGVGLWGLVVVSGVQWNRITLEASLLSDVAAHKRADTAST